MNSAKLPAHLQGLAEAYDRKMAQFGFQLIDRTPEGYGPGPNAGEQAALPHLTTEEQAALRTRNEAATIQRARKAKR